MTDPDAGSEVPPLDPQAGIGATLDRAAAMLRAAGIDSARLDARLIVAAATGWSREELLVEPRRVPGEGAFEAIAAMVQRRAGREPLSHILGTREFWSLPFRVTADVLTPRPESETLIEAVVARARGRTAPAALLDLGTGSGCLLLALLSELPHAIGTGVDRSAAALAVAAGNARALGLAGRATWRQGSWTEGLDGRFDVIVSNPPYIPSSDIAGLADEVARFEPRAALDGGRDGFDAYRALMPGVRRLVARGGLVAFEVGAGQAGAVAALAAASGLTPAGTCRDLAGIERVVLAEG
ncbi:MAG: peptide chain release factor N(5)-glutamine methyltransferase [Alphaproteobacteria bacterium]